MLNSEDLINKVKVYNKFLNPERLNKDWKHPVTKHHIKRLILSLPNRDITSIKKV